LLRRLVAVLTPLILALMLLVGVLMLRAAAVSKP
jgi:hypothetical protein